jgi:hypothetical protein
MFSLDSRYDHCYRDEPKHPVREVIKAFIGVYPPWYVKGYWLRTLSEDDWQRFNDWLGPRIKPQWLTNYGFTDAVDAQVQAAIDNGNIPDDPDRPPLPSKKKRRKTK